MDQLNRQQQINSSRKEALIFLTRKNSLPIFSSRHSMVTTVSFRKAGNLSNKPNRWSVKGLQPSLPAAGLERHQANGPHCDSQSLECPYSAHVPRQRHDRLGSSWPEAWLRMQWGEQQGLGTGMGRAQARAGHRQHTPLLCQSSSVTTWFPCSIQEQEPTWGPHVRSSAEGVELPSPSPTALWGYSDNPNSSNIREHSRGQPFTQLPLHQPCQQWHPPITPISNSIKHSHAYGEKQHLYSHAAHNWHVI